MIWIYDLTDGSKQVVSPAANLHVGTISFGANGELVYQAYDQVAEEARLSSCPQGL